jgi:hypothetical protein
MTAVTQEQNLVSTLSKLESALLSPPVAGELAQWTEAVRQAAATLAVDLAAFQRTVLQVQYDQIATTDPEMSAHVEKLRSMDGQLLTQITEFHEALHALADAAAHVPKNEGKLAQQRQHVEESGIALILAIKKQQAAAATWLEEAHFRDRGVAAD